MKRFLVLFVLGLSLTACDGSRTENVIPESEAAKPEQPSATPADDIASVKPDTTVVAGPETSVSLPEDIHFDFPYTLRADRTAESPKGEPRRWVGLEYTTGDQQVTLSAIEKAMASAGFSAKERTSGENGGQRQLFLKENYGRVLVTVLGSDGQKFANPDARGVIWLDFPRN